VKIKKAHLVGLAIASLALMGAECGGAGGDRDPKSTIVKPGALCANRGAYGYYDRVRYDCLPDRNGDLRWTKSKEK
jgi:hypothetical protein